MLEQLSLQERSTVTTHLAIGPNFPDFDPDAALRQIRGAADWVGLRYVEECNQRRACRNGRPEANAISLDRGVMLEAMVDGQFGYGATSDLSSRGILRALERAVELAKAGPGRRLFRFDETHRPPTVGQHRSPRRLGLDSATLGEFTDHLVDACRQMQVSDCIVNTVAEATLVETRWHYVTSGGASLLQEWLLVSQSFSATAQDGSESQHRSLNGHAARSYQSGLEAFDWDNLRGEWERLGREALELLYADECPETRTDLILAPDQMMLQIHESIGHPLELDRILGDERNYAGWSFVRSEDFGRLRYGSELMNVTFDPSYAGEFAGYAFDDCGRPATREYLIRQGVLQRGLGSLESEARLGIPGVANFRACNWNRPPIDRMANINLEPGQQSLAELIGGVERGVYMQSNRSWSIDDYRNKFQFGCEYARAIENGKLGKVLRNPGYRGITVPFWNSLKGVGRAEDMEAFGTPFCGKGEPNQAIRVGHAAPPCWFGNVEVFGGGL